mgnify:CR=1 FL=1
MKTRQAILCIIALLLLFPTVSFSQSDLTNTELEVEELIRLSVKSIRTDLDSSVIYANMIIAYGEDRNSLKYLSLGYKNLGQSYRYMNQQEKAREAYHKAVEYAEKNNDAESAARIYPLIAHTYAAKGDNKNAMKWQKTAKLKIIA